MVTPELSHKEKAEEDVGVSPLQKAQEEIVGKSKLEPGKQSKRKRPKEEPFSRVRTV